MSSSPTNFLIYGANGYTGELIARLAVEQGLRPVLSGRNREAVAALAHELGLDFRIANLDAPAELDLALADMGAVIHCAGPFWRTAAPMVDACLRNRVDYLDITGEIAVFEALHRRDAEAKTAGIMLLPGAGFDVVPSDCLAAHLKRRLPTATHLTLAFKALGGISRGTAITAVESLGKGSGGVIRRDGALTPIPPGSKTRRVDFGRGPRQTVCIPWGDVSTAYFSTGIPNIEVYMAMSGRMIRGMQMGRYAGPLLGLAPVQALLKQGIRARAPGPSDAMRAKSISLLWGMAADGGQRVETRMTTPEGYTLTAQTALHIAGKVMAGDAPAGFQTPSTAYGADLIMEIDGVTRADLGA